MIASHNNDTGKNSDKKTLSIVHLLHPYVKQRIRVGENLGIFPKNMYRSNGIIDEVVLKVYEKGLQEDVDSDELRMIMFDLANGNLKTLFEKEKWHKNSISTKFILEEELKQLEENFTMDAGNDLIMNEELDDISYHQNDHERPELPYDDTQDIVLAFLEINDAALFENYKNKNMLEKMYDLLPVQTSNVVDLYILGKLNLQEIATILKIEIVEVKRIIDSVKETFKKHLD